MELFNKYQKGLLSETVPLSMFVLDKLSDPN